MTSPFMVLVEAKAFGFCLLPQTDCDIIAVSRTSSLVPTWQVRLRCGIHSVPFAQEEERV